MNENTIIIIVFLVYMAVLFLIGFIASKRTKTEEDFFLAGRKIGTWVTAISSTASSESGWVVLGTVGLVYKDGLSAMWFMPGCLLGYWFNWRFIAPKLRRISGKSNAITIPDIIENINGQKSNIVRMVAVIIIFLSMMAYVAAQLTAAGKAFNATFSIEYSTSIIIGGSIVIFYTLLGGFRAVSWTDLMQGLLMVFALVVLPFIAVFYAGGVDKIIDDLSKYPGYLSIFKTDGTIYAAIGSVLGLLGIGFGYPGQPHVLARYMAASDDSVIKRGKKIAITWGILVYSGAILLGLAGKSIIPEVSDQEHVFPMLSGIILHPVLAGIMLSAVMSSIMSTADSQLLVASSALVRDTYEMTFEKRIEEKKLLIIIRITVLLLGLLSLLVALTDTRIVFWFVLFAWSGLGASFGPLIILLLNGYRFKASHLVTGMLLGFIITIVWKVSGLSDFLYEIIPAFFIAFIYLVITGKKNE